jgi:DNA-binding Lrp family transcriptional regulator
MNKFDRNILDYLAGNARLSNAEIARKIGLSRTAVANRIKKLETQGVIQGYYAQLQLPDNSVTAYFHLNFSHGSCEDLVAQITVISQVRECHSAIGDIDMIIYARAQSMEEMEEVRLQLEKLPRLTSITTKAVYKKLISR